MTYPFDLSGVLSDAERTALTTPRVSRYVPHVPTEQQTLALIAPRFLPSDAPVELFYGGAAGGGKSDLLLMAALEYVDVPGYAAILFRRTYTDLALPGALMDRARQWLTGTDATWNEQQKRWTFPSGATLAFGYLEGPSDVYRYQSAEFQLIGFDELTQFEPASYEYLFSRLRRPKEGALGTVPLRMFSASNPGGVGHGWVKKRFITEATRGSRVFVPAKIADNPHLDVDGYRSSLSHLEPTLRRQLEDGDWQVAEGLAFPEFRPAVHCVEAFPIPPHWQRFEFMDHGIANPCAWFVAATDEDGNLVVFDSYYSPGNVSEHCRAIVARRPAWWPDGYFDADGRYVRQNVMTFADPSVRNRTGGAIRSVLRFGEPATIATEYAEQSNGAIELRLANNDPRAGRARVAELLKLEPGHRAPYFAPQLEAEKAAPKLYVVASRCRELVEQLENAPLLPLDSGRRGAGEIVDPTWESRAGHCIAALRYGVMSRPEASERVTFDPLAPVDWEQMRGDMQRELLHRWEKRVESGEQAERSFYGGPRYVDV